MGLTVNLRTNRGQIYDRKFLVNEGISIYGKSTTLTGLINPGTHVRLEVLKNDVSIFTKETNTNLWGDYDFWYVTPNADVKLTLRLTATYPVSGQDVVLYPIAVGNTQPDPLPTPNQENSFLQYMPILLIAVLGYQLLKD